MKARRCECCGQLIPPFIKIQGPVKKAIYDFVSKHPEGVTTTQIINHVYANDVNGGPLTNTIRVLVHRLNAELQCFGLMIRSSKGPGSTYTLRNMRRAATINDG